MHIGARKKQNRLTSTDIPIERLVIKSLIVSILVFLAFSLVFWRLKKGL
jgi:hypothetical protein